MTRVSRRSSVVGHYKSMQLRTYFFLLRRFWPLVLGLPLVVAVASLLLGMNRPASYQASARLMISQVSYTRQAEGNLPDFDINYSWNSSTYILDDLPQVVNSVAFAQDVQAFLTGEGKNVELTTIQGSLRAEVLHRSVYLAAVNSDPDTALAIVRGAVYAIETNGLKYWNRDQTGDNGLNVAVLDPPGGVATLSSNRALIMEVGLRTVLALAAALGIALLITYLDDRLRSPAQAEEWLGTSVLGMIPKE
jgi:capsular polysaccharide biosynthesis protein